MAHIGALAELGGTYLEVQGKVIMRTAKRISDLANDEDDLLDLDVAQIRVHNEPAGLWEEVSSLSLNREALLLIIPTAENHVGRNDLRAPGRRVRVKLYCGPLQVTGFITVPLEQTVASWHRTVRARFLGVTQARVQPIVDTVRLDAKDSVHKFVLINRKRMTALIESRAASARVESAVAEPVASSSEAG